MNKAKIESTIRTVLKIVGTTLVAFFGFDDGVIATGTDAIISLFGAVMTVVAWIQSIRAPEKRIPEAMRADLRKGQEVSEKDYQALKVKFMKAA